MATGAAADGLFWSVFEGCISCHDSCVERRPYHRKCRCALHTKKLLKNAKHMLLRCNAVSYPMKRAWSEGNLVLDYSSPSLSSATRGMSHLNLVNLAEEEEIK